MNIRQTKMIDIEYTKKGEKLIDTFTLTELNAESALKYGKKLQKVLLPVYAEFIGNINKYKQEVELDDEGEVIPQGIPPELLADVLSKAAQAISELDEKDAIALVCEACSLSPAKFNERFSGKLVVFAKLLKEVVMFNFEDVFTELGLDGI